MSNLDVVGLTKCGNAFIEATYKECDRYKVKVGEEELELRIFGWKVPVTCSMGGVAEVVQKVHNGKVFTSLSPILWNSPSQKGTPGTTETVGGFCFRDVGSTGGAILNQNTSWFQWVEGDLLIPKEEQTPGVFYNQFFGRILPEKK